MPATPAAGGSMRRNDMFSDPEPFGIMRSSSESPSARNSQSTTGIRHPVFV